MGLAPLLFGVILLPALGAKWSLIAAAAAYLLLVPLPEIRLPRLVPTALALPVLAALPANLLLVDAPPGSRIVAYRQGVMAAVAVTEDHSGRRLLKVNNRFFMGGMVHSFADRRQAHIPLLLHPAPRRVLFLGLGSGITAGAATEEPGVQVTGVELLPTVVDFLPWFASANHLDRWRQPGRLVIADARRYIRSAGERFDVIVADLFHPARDGAGALYTQEHFQAVRRRLNEEGLFCQWLPLYQLDLESLQLIVRTFMAVFPAARGYLAHFNVETPMLGLVGRREARRFPPEWYAARVGGDTGLAAALEELALGRDLTLLGCLLAGTADLRALAGEGPLNTDDHPRVTFLAPRFTYSKSAPPYGRLEAMLAACHPSAADLVEGEGPGARAFRARLDRYLAARDEYLRGAMLVAGGARRRGFDAMVEAVRRSPEFRTAYATCLQEVMMRAGSDRAEARHILQGLAEADPGNPRAATLLRRLDAGG